MKVYEGQNVKGSLLYKGLNPLKNAFRKVCEMTCMDLQSFGSFLGRFWKRPAVTCMTLEKAYLCRSMQVYSEKCLIGGKNEKKSPYRRFTDTRCIDLHKVSGTVGSVRERDVEHTLVTEVRKRGGLAPKLVSPGTAGMPDRIVLMSEGRMAFVELKAPGKKPRRIQEKRISDLRALGYRVFVVDTAERVKEVIDAVQSASVSEEG